MDVQRDGFLRLAVEPPHRFCEHEQVIVALDGKFRASDGRPVLPVVAVFVPPAEAEVRLVDGVLAGLAARLALRERAADELAVLVDGRAVPAAAERCVIRDALREIFVFPILPIVVVVLAPVVDGIRRVLLFAKEIAIVLRRCIRILRLARRAVHVVRLLRGEIAVDIRIVRIAVLRFLVHEIAVHIMPRDVLKRNRPGERYGLVIFFVVSAIVRIVIIAAAPDGTHEMPLDRRPAVRPVRDVDDALLLPALNDVERIAAQEHVDLPLRQARCPAEQRRDEILVRHAAVLVVLRRDEIVAVHVDVPIHRRRDLLHVIRDERFVNADIDGRVKERVAVVHSLDALNEPLLRRLFHEKAKMVIHELPFDRVPDGERLDGFELERIGKRELAERERKRSDAERMEWRKRMVRVRGGQAVRDASFRVGCNRHPILEHTTRAAGDLRWNGNTAMRVAGGLHVLDERSCNVELCMNEVDISARIKSDGNVVDAVVRERPRCVEREFRDGRHHLPFGIGGDSRRQRASRVRRDARNEVALGVCCHFRLWRGFDARDVHGGTHRQLARHDAGQIHGRSDARFPCGKSRNVDRRL